jgi:hypothetical protein
VSPLPLAGGVSLHGIGGAKDLPISPALAIAGAVAALTVSFTVLALAWRKPRYDGVERGRVTGLSTPTEVPVVAAILRIFGLVVFLYAAVAGIVGKDLLTNPIFGMFYVWWWVGLPLLSVLLGPVWRAISPARTINLLFAKVTRGDPAALGLFAFVWMELVYPYSTELASVRLWCSVYVALMLLGGALFGSRFYERGDPFEVYSTLAGKLSIWGSRDGKVVMRSPLAGLSTVTASPGLIGVVAVLFGSTAFDSFRDSIRWVSFVQNSDRSPYLMNNLGLLAFCTGVGLIFAAGTMASGVEPGFRRRTLPDLFAHSVVPIVIGYIVAHYLTFWFETGQQTLIQASDPLSNGANYLGTANWSVNYWLSLHPTLLADLKVISVVTGHVLGVISAHDRAMKILPKKHQLTGQLPLLVAMVAFTVGGLYLLFAA